MTREQALLKLSRGKRRSHGGPVQSRLQKYPSDKGCTVVISGALEEVVELGWLHAKMHHAHKDAEEKDLREWIRGNAEPSAD